MKTKHSILFLLFNFFLSRLLKQKSEAKSEKKKHARPLSIFFCSGRNQETIANNFKQPSSYFFSYSRLEFYLVIKVKAIFRILNSFQKKIFFSLILIFYSSYPKFPSFSFEPSTFITAGKFF